IKEAANLSSASRRRFSGSGSDSNQSRQAAGTSPGGSGSRKQKKAVERRAAWSLPWRCKAWRISSSVMDLARGADEQVAAAHLVQADGHQGLPARLLLGDAPAQINLINCARFQFSGIEHRRGGRSALVNREKKLTSSSSTNILRHSRLSWGNRHLVSRSRSPCISRKVDEMNTRDTRQRGIWHTRGSGASTCDRGPPPPPPLTPGRFCGKLEINIHEQQVGIHSLPVAPQEGLDPGVHGPVGVGQQQQGVHLLATSQQAVQDHVVKILQDAAFAEADLRHARGGGHLHRRLQGLAVPGDPVDHVAAEARHGLLSLLLLPVAAAATASAPSTSATTATTTAATSPTGLRRSWTRRRCRLLGQLGNGLLCEWRWIAVGCLRHRQAHPLARPGGVKLAGQAGLVELGQTVRVALADQGHHVIDWPIDVQLPDKLLQGEKLLPALLGPRTLVGLGLSIEIHLLPDEVPASVSVCVAAAAVAAVNGGVPCRHCGSNRCAGACTAGASTTATAATTATTATTATGSDGGLRRRRRCSGRVGAPPAPSAASATASDIPAASAAAPPESRSGSGSCLTVGLLGLLLHGLLLVVLAQLVGVEVRELRDHRLAQRGGQGAPAQRPVVEGLVDFGHLNPVGGQGHGRREVLFDVGPRQVGHGGVGQQEVGRSADVQLLAGEQRHLQDELRIARCAFVATALSGDGVRQLHQLTAQAVLGVLERGEEGRGLDGVQQGFTREGAQPFASNLGEFQSAVVGRGFLGVYTAGHALGAALVVRMAELNRSLSSLVDTPRVVEIPARLVVVAAEVAAPRWPLAAGGAVRNAVEVPRLSCRLSDVDAPLGRLAARLEPPPVSTDGRVVDRAVDDSRLVPKPLVEPMVGAVADAGLSPKLVFSFGGMASLELRTEDVRDNLVLSDIAILAETHWHELLHIRVKLQSVLDIVNVLPVGHVDAIESPELKDHASNALSDARSLACLYAQRVLGAPLDSTAAEEAAWPSSLEAQLEERQRALLAWHEPVLADWHERASLASVGGGGGINKLAQHPVQRLQALLADRERLIARSRLNRCHLRPLRLPGSDLQQPASEPMDTSDPDVVGDQPEAKLSDPPESDSRIYDDSDLYKLTLLDFVHSRTAGLTDPAALGQEFARLQQLRRRLRKRANVDTRASKARRLRYLEMPRLVGFATASEPPGQLTEGQRRELAAGQVRLSPWSNVEVAPQSSTLVPGQASLQEPLVDRQAPRHMAVARLRKAPEAPAACALDRCADGLLDHRRTGKRKTQPQSIPALGPLVHELHHSGIVLAQNDVTFGHLAGQLGEVHFAQALRAVPATSTGGAVDFGAHFERVGPGASLLEGVSAPVQQQADGLDGALALYGQVQRAEPVRVSRLRICSTVQQLAEHQGILARFRGAAAAAEPAASTVKRLGAVPEAQLAQDVRHRSPVGVSGIQHRSRLLLNAAGHKESQQVHEHLHVAAAGAQVQQGAAVLRRGQHRPHSVGQQQLAGLEAASQDCVAQRVHAFGVHPADHARVGLPGRFDQRALFALVGVARGFEQAGETGQVVNALLNDEVLEAGAPLVVAAVQQVGRLQAGCGEQQLGQAALSGGVGQCQNRLAARIRRRRQAAAEQSGRQLGVARPHRVEQRVLAVGIQPAGLDAEQLALLGDANCFATVAEPQAALCMSRVRPALSRGSSEVPAREVLNQRPAVRLGRVESRAATVGVDGGFGQAVVAEVGPQLLQHRRLAAGIRRCQRQHQQGDAAVVGCRLEARRAIEQVEEVRGAALHRVEIGVATLGVLQEDLLLWDLAGRGEPRGIDSCHQPRSCRQPMPPPSPSPSAGAESAESGPRDRARTQKNSRPSSPLALAFAFAVSVAAANRNRQIVGLRHLGEEHRRLGVAALAGQLQQAAPSLGKILPVGHGCASHADELMQQLLILGPDSQGQGALAGRVDGGQVHQRGQRVSAAQQEVHQSPVAAGDAGHEQPVRCLLGRQSAVQQQLQQVRLRIGDAVKKRVSTFGVASPNPVAVLIVAVAPRCAAGRRAVRQVAGDSAEPPSSAGAGAQEPLKRRQAAALDSGAAVATVASGQRGLRGRRKQQVEQLVAGALVGGSISGLVPSLPSASSAHPGAHQQAQAVQGAGRAAVVSGRLAGHVATIHASSVAQQQLDDGLGAGEAGDHQRGDAGRVRQVEVGAAADEQLGRGHVTF
uniref:TRAUB domain-containing protein n=1 Tax=Macrostomum lignano TaxID=282301 RepID=A0A1I8FY89_9PLAT